MTPMEPVPTTFQTFIIVASLALTVLGIVGAYFRGKIEAHRHAAIIAELTRIAATIMAEGQATRQLLDRQEKRRRRMQARAARLRLEFGGPAAEALIGISQIVDADGGDA